MSSYGLYTSGLGAMGQSAKVDLIANNLANVSTPGFRREQMSFRERLVEALEDQPDLQHYNALVDRHGGAPFIDKVRFDDQAGGYERTHRPLDFALVSRGFFVVRETETGRSFYTRAGNFTLNGEGALVTADGRCQVMSADETPVAVDATASGDIRLSPDGILFQGGVEVAELGVTDFADYDYIRRRGESLFENTGSAAFVPGDIRLEQGVLEGSSVSPVTEMVEMIKALRALETNLQMIRFQDSTLDRAVNELGRMTR